MAVIPKTMVKPAMKPVATSSSSPGSKQRSPSSAVRSEISKGFSGPGMPVEHILDRSVLTCPTRRGRTQPWTPAGDSVAHGVTSQDRRARWRPLNSMRLLLGRMESPWSGGYGRTAGLTCTVSGLPCARDHQMSRTAAVFISKWDATQSAVKAHSAV